MNIKFITIVILDDDQKCYIPTSGRVKVFTFLDGSEHIMFNDKWYDIKPVKDFQYEVKKITSTKTQEQINKSKAHDSTNSPWCKGLPPLVSHKSINYAINHGC